jgi:membrane-bound metal-dependent hydrolase YbcI (DUF457 family)
MYLLTHLLTGILLGILLAFIFRETLLILACAIGSLLPDLIDKPVGILLFHQTIGYGRIYCHTLLFAILVIFIGIVVYSRYKSTGIVIIALATGILSHQLLDTMWLETASWFWPVLGQFTGRSRSDFFWNTFWNDITNPTEWLAGGIILAFLIIYLIPRYRERFFSFLIEKGESRQSLLFVLLIIAVSALFLLVGVWYE